MKRKSCPKQQQNGSGFTPSFISRFPVAGVPNDAPIDLEDKVTLDESYHKVISEWEHFGFLELFDVNNFNVNDLDDVAEKFGISKLRTEVVIKNLLDLELITKDDNGKYKRAHQDIQTTKDIKSISIRKSHFESLELAKDKLEKVDLEHREFSTLTVAIDSEMMNEFKAMTREFNQKVVSLSKSKHLKDEVYQLNIQFFPLTTKKNKEK